MIFQNSLLSKYHQLREYYQEKILNGDLAIGDTLPSERELARKTNISIGTIRKAYEELQKDGYVERIQGKGTVVVNSHAARPILTIGTYEPFPIHQGLCKIAELWNNMGKPFEVKFVFLEKQNPSFEEAFRIFDIVLPIEGFLPLLRQKQYAEPLKGKIDIKEFNQIALANYLTDPELRSIPLTYSPFLMWINHDILNQVGFPAPKNWNWENFKAFFDKCVASTGNIKDKVYAFSTSIWPYWWLPFMWQNSCPVFSSAETVNKAAFEEALNFCYEIFTSPAFFVQNNYTMTISPEKLFRSGKTGLAFFGYYHLNTGILNDKIKWSLSSLPSHKRKATSMYTVSLAVSKYSKKKRECMEFLHEILSTEWQLLMLKEANFLPVRALDTRLIKECLGKEKHKVYNKFKEQIPYSYSVVHRKSEKLEHFWQQFGLVLSGLAPKKSMWELYNENKEFQQDNWVGLERVEETTQAFN
ncbi:MAG: extracellular solute-binding protein [Victivallales bacterium]